MTVVLSKYLYSTALDFKGEKNIVKCLQVSTTYFR